MQWKLYVLVSVSETEEILKGNQGEDLPVEAKCPKISMHTCKWCIIS